MKLETRNDLIKKINNLQVVICKAYNDGNNDIELSILDILDKTLDESLVDVQNLSKLHSFHQMSKYEVQSKKKEHSFNQWEHYSLHDTQQEALDQLEKESRKKWNDDLDFRVCVVIADNIVREKYVGLSK